MGKQLAATSKSAGAACVLHGWQTVQVSAVRASIADVVNHWMLLHPDRAFTIAELRAALCLGSNEVHGAIGPLLANGVIVRDGDDAYALGLGIPEAAQPSGRARAV